jgi:hypothetical protein
LSLKTLGQSEHRRACWAAQELADAETVRDWMVRIRGKYADGEIDDRPDGWRGELVGLAQLTGAMADDARLRATIESAEPDDLWVAEQRRAFERRRRNAGAEAYVFPAHLLGPSAAAYPPPDGAPTAR